MLRGDMRCSRCGTWKDVSTDKDTLPLCTVCRKRAKQRTAADLYKNKGGLLNKDVKQMSNEKNRLKGSL